MRINSHTKTKIMILPYSLKRQYHRLDRHGVICFVLEKAVFLFNKHL